MCLKVLNVFKKKKKYGEDCVYFEVTCEAYWECILEFDPDFQSSDIELFKKCPSKCGADHDDDVFCELEVFHEPYQVELPYALPNGKIVRYISRDGHGFSCSHDGDRFHTFFIIDQSGSMYDDSASPTLPWITQRNKFGAVIEAIYHYTSKRVRQNPSDLFSFISFHSEASLIASSVAKPDVRSLLNHVCPASWTSFCTGFQAASDTCQKELTPSYTPIFIFLSDGQDCGGSEVCDDVINNHLLLFPETVIHAIGFGDDADESRLREIAVLGNGQFHGTTDTVSLCNAFVSISVQPDCSFV
ncbi:hypothetical protein GEMRC1_008278 [Eukaryota sp. GEM-RC1]